MDMDRRNRIAQWAFDTRAILGRFHLWLDDVEEQWLRGGVRPGEAMSFAGTALEASFAMTAAVTALGTRLFGRFGEGRGLDKAGFNRVKKDADAVSAYAMSEALWHMTRALPENHALMVSLGEGLMPKVGETPEMGSNPLLGFGRVYARPQVARFLDRRVHRLINEPSYGWDGFWAEVQNAGITVWGAAIDTLENTSRFAKGSPTGPMAVLHVFDQPLRVALPYEGYMGTLVLPRAVVTTAAERSVLVDYFTPRDKVLDAIRLTYPGVAPDRVHVWTLGGKARESRIGSLWEEWRRLGVHVVHDGWMMPTGREAFTESGTYAPSFMVGPFTDADGAQHLLLVDGYAASAEAIQAASLDPVLDTVTSMALFTPKFEVSWEKEREIMRLDPGDPDFRARLGAVLGAEVSETTAQEYAGILRHARAASMWFPKRSVTAEDFFPKKEWDPLALVGCMLPDPYTGSNGVEQLDERVYRVTTLAGSRKGLLRVVFTLRLMETLEESRLVFSPLLDRFYAGQDYRTRPVKISDSGRIRNELQTWCSEALEYLPDDRIRVHFEKVDDAVLSPEKKAFIAEVLAWYKANHPIWFRWLELA